MWLVKQGAHWRITRDFDAIELAVETRLAVTVHFEEAGFYWLTAEDRRTGWLPTIHVSLDS